MENVPNEILCELFSYVTDVDDVLNLMQVNKIFHGLLLYCVRHINGNIIPAKLILNLPFIVTVNGIVQVDTTDTLQQLKYIPSLRKIRIQSTQSNETVESQFGVFNSLIEGKDNLVDLNLSYQFTPNTNYPVEIIGLSNNLLYVYSKLGLRQFPINYSLILRQLQKFNNLGIDTLMTDIPYILYPCYRHGHFMTCIKTIYIQLDSIPAHDDELFSSIAELSNMGILNHLKLTLSKKNMSDNYVKTYYGWIYDCILGAEGYTTHSPLQLDIPLYLYRDSINRILNIFTNIRVISIMYTPQIDLLVRTLNTLLEIPHIQTIKLYSDSPMDLPDNYLSNPRIQCVSYFD